MTIDASELVLLALNEAGMTQRALADGMDVTEARVSRMLREDWNPQLSTLERVAKALGAELVIEFRR